MFLKKSSSLILLFANIVKVPNIDFRPDIKSQTERAENFSLVSFGEHVLDDMLYSQDTFLWTI